VGPRFRADAHTAVEPTVLDNTANLEDDAMTMTTDEPASSEIAHVLVAPEYGVLDFNAPATIGIVLYESQRTTNVLRGEMAAMEKSIRSDTAAMEKSIRSDMAAMEKSIRSDIRSLVLIMVSLHGITLAAMGAMFTLL
jgi:hypothetical protein